MVVRPLARTADTFTATATVDADEPDAIEHEPVWVTEPLDLRHANPFRLIGRALGPVIIALFASWILFVAMPKRMPIDRIAGKSIPVSVVVAGAVLSKTDSVTNSGNYTIAFPADVESTLMLVWDYAAEDGDMVQVLVNGSPMEEAFTIMHGAKVVRVPTGANISVIGTRDGGGGITYAVNFPEAGRSMVNGVQTGETNQYSLRRQVPNPGAQR
jgi:hypothetical protein